jgi:hypothetical protein
MRIVWSSLLVVSLGLIAWGAMEAGQAPAASSTTTGEDGSGYPPPPPPPPPTEAGQ